MKKFVTLLLISCATFVCKANNPIDDCNAREEINDTDIPKEVKKWLENELASSTTKVLESFETPNFYTNKKAKIIGYIKDYDKTLGAKTGIFYYKNQLTRENKPRVIEIHEDGRFELELPLAYPTQSSFVIKQQVIGFYLEPGQNLSVILNWEDIKQPRRISYPLKNVVYQGPLGQINTDLLQFKPDYNSGEFQRKEGIMKPVPFKNDMLKFKRNALNKVNAYEQSGEIDKKTSELLRNEIILQTYYSLFDYYSPTHSPRYGQGKRKANNIDDTLPNDYYDFIKDLPLHKQALLVSNRFSSFINRLEYAKPLQSKVSRRVITARQTSMDFLKFLESKNVKVNDEDKKLLELVTNEINETNALSKELQVKVGAFYKKHQSFSKAYSALINEKREIAWKNNFTKKWKAQDSLATNFGVKNNLIYEIVKLRALKFVMESNTYKDKAWYWSELKKSIKSPHLIKLGNDLYDQETSKSEFYELPENEKGTDIFKKIIAPYKGKVVVLQFWNPYSYYQGDGLERIKQRRNSYKNNKDVVFLFITNKEGSSLKKYKASVQKNGFENSTRMPQDDYNYMRQLFKFNKSVNDILIDKDGNVISNDFATHNMEYIFKEKFNISPDKE